MDLDIATSKGLVGAVIVNDHFAAVLVPDLDAEGVSLATAEQVAGVPSDETSEV